MAFRLHELLKAIWYSVIQLFAEFLEQIPLPRGPGLGIKEESTPLTNRRVKADAAHTLRPESFP